MKKLLITLLVLFAFGSSQAFAAEEYKVQSQWGPGHTLSKNFWEAWCKEMSAKTGGKAVFHYFALGGIGTMDSSPMAMRNGAIDMGGVSVSTAMAMFPYSQALGLPFLVQDSREASIMYDAMYNNIPEVKQELDKAYKVLAFCGSDRLAFFSSSGLITKPSDLKGKRVLVWSQAQVDEIKEWGGIPVNVANNETYMGLQRGMGEVAYVPAPAVSSIKLFEVAKFITVIPSRTMGMVIGANWDAWKSMPKEVQKMIEDDMGYQRSVYLGTALTAVTDRDLEYARAQGGTVHVLSLEEQAVFKDAAAKVNDKYWLDTFTRLKVKDPAGYIARVEKLAAETFKR